MINVAIKYHTYHIGIFNIRKLLDKMIVDWKMWNSKEEVEIMRRYAEEGRLYTLAYTIYIYVSTVLFLSTSFIPLVLDVIVPLNESRPLQPVVLGEYFVDQEKHFYPIYCHMVFTILLSMTALIAADSQFFVFTCHACGVFSVVGFRLERLMKDAGRSINYLGPKESFKYVALSIKGHSRAIEFANLIESSFSTPLLIQCGINIACLSVSLYRMTTLIEMSAEVLRYVAFLIAQLFHIFCICYSGQRIIDHSSETHSKAYNGLWYEAPIKTRKLLLLVFRRSLEPSQLTGGKVFVFCLKGFSTIVQTSTSYFMVLSSGCTRNQRLQSVGETRTPSLSQGRTRKTCKKMLTTINYPAFKITLTLENVDTTERCNMQSDQRCYEYFMRNRPVGETSLSLLEEFFAIALLSCLCNNMDILEQRFYKLNYRLLSFLGLWPYQKSRVFALFTFTGEFGVIAECIPIWVTSINIGIKYHTYNLGVINVKALLDDMIADWKMWRYKKEESEIMVKFAEMARIYTLIYAIYLYIAMGGFLLATLVPPIMDMVIPLNESRSTKLPVVSEYFIDQNKYFYPIYAHVSIIITILVTIIIAADTQLMVFSCHVSALFAVVGFRLEHYLKGNITLEEMSDRQREECYKHITLSIKTHERAIQFANRIESLFSYSLLLQCGFNVVCMSTSLYQIVILLGKSAEALKFISFVFAQLFHLFCASYSGQQIIDHSSEVYYKAYSGFWYEIPVKVRKLLILVMRRSLEPSRLTAGKLFVFCLESFSTILQTSTSYFMGFSVYRYSMVDYLSKSSSNISDKNNEKHSDLKACMSTSAIMSSSLKHQDQTLSPEDVASNALTSLFNETVGCINHQRYMKTPIPWLSSRQQYASIPSSSNQAGPNLQRRCIVHRHVSPHPPFSRQGITDVNAFKSVRKTRSMTFPTITNMLWHRSETASTPDLKIDQHNTDYVSISPKRNIRWRRMYEVFALTYNIHVIEIALDCIILVAGFVHLALAIVLAMHEDVILTLIKQELFTLLRTTFIAVSLMLLIFSTTALSFLHKGEKRRATHAACSVIVAVIMLFLASMQYRVENNILKNIESSMLSMIKSETMHFPSSTWDKFHKTFKCCGAKGNLDWCQKEKFHEETDLKIHESNSMNFLGFYTCHIPESCCKSSLNEYNASAASNSQKSCSLYPTPWNTYRPGCMTPLKLEVYYMSRLYRVLCFTTITVLLLSMTTSIFLCTYP
ncbi:hypothetical protein KPH14_003010 [Odynerus spinipes]|uniref:Odorant receptor n=1 Tax=Odynerus spinipes TaxID=1348599 RepID=A0AAD9VUB4_9HYME|nr:hypothetical protein KPH14_003010 [Odynerus spinipes]